MKPFGVLVVVVCTILLTEARSHHHLPKNTSSKRAKVEHGGTKRSALTSLDKEFPASTKESKINSYASLLAKVLGDGGSNPDQSSNTYSGMIEALNMKTKDKNVFNILEEKMGTSPSQEFENTVSQEKEFLRNVESRNIELTKATWVQLKNMKDKFLPQKNSFKDYKKDFYPDLSAYLLIFVGATMDLVFKGEVDKCQLSKELDLFKYETETAVQDLIFKRIQMLEDKSTSWAHFTGYTWMNYEDKLTGQKLCSADKDCQLKGDGNTIPVLNTIEKVSDTVLSDADKMFEVVDEVLSALATGGSLCFDGCDCPEPEQVKVERKRYTKDYPWSCMGTNKREKSSAADRVCVLPCGKYGYDYEWCPTEFGATGLNWDKCEVADWSSCAQGWYK